MIDKKEISQARELLEASQNPVFFFDNDPDGLASFLLLRRCIGRGKGIVIKSFPDLNASYVRKVHELKPDCVFILDKPIVDDAFVKETLQLGVRIVWIDHHLPQNAEGISYFNPLLSEKPSNEPTSYWCYKIANKKEDKWIALLGCISDWFMPDFFDDVHKEYPDLLPDVETAAKALYETQFGRLAKVLSFAMKDRTTNVVRMLKFLVQIKSPYDLMEENANTSSIYHRFNQIDKKYRELLQKAKSFARHKMLFFQYGGDLSISGELANELFYNYQDKVVVVAYLKGAEAKLSIRAGREIRSAVAGAMEGIEGRSGGHERACAATMQISDLPKFRENLERGLK